MRKIVGVFARHGFANLAERIELGHFILNKIRSPQEAQQTLPERLRRCFEELGPTFVKLGQVLATRPDLVPVEVAEEFAKLHDQVRPLPFGELRPHLIQHFGRDLDSVFASIEENALAAASMAQVHRAVLRDGRRVVIKVLRPGLDKIIEQDLSVMYMIAALIEKYVPEARVYQLGGIVEEFFDTLKLETNLAIEANNTRRLRQNFESFPNVKIPEVIGDLSGEKVLVLEEIVGLRLSQYRPSSDLDADADQVLRTGMKAYFKMVFTDGFFHADLHPGNVFLLPNDKLALVDFGVVGRLNQRSKTSIANMLVCLATEDYDRLAAEYVDLAPFSEHVEPDEMARQLRNLISPYYGLTLRHVNAGQLLLRSASIAAAHQLALPRDLMLFFKSIAAMESLARMLNREFDFLSEAIDFSAELVQLRFDPSRMSKDFFYWGRDLQALFADFPRQLRQYLRRVNSPEHVTRIELRQLEDLNRSLIKAAGLVFWALIISAMIVSGALLASTAPAVGELRVHSSSMIAFILAGLSLLWVFFRYRR